MSLDSVFEKLSSIESLLKEQTLSRKSLLTFKEAMYVLGISKNTLYELIRRKKIPAYRPVKGKVFFIQKELKYWITSQRAVSIFTVEKMDHDDCEIHDSDL